ncbi:MAG: ImmA/IrrE family metallo-endopeptidase [Ahrensia sp.]
MVADFKLAERRAYETLDKLGLKKAPIDPEYVAESLGVPVRYAHFSEDVSRKISGYISFKPSAQIIINAKDAPNRKTFTIAHELAHYLMHETYAKSNGYQVMPRSYSHGNEKPDEEKEADAFAAHLLVPTHELRKYKAWGVSTPEMARIFAVSEDVIKNRMPWV